MTIRKVITFDRERFVQECVKNNYRPSKATDLSKITDAKSIVFVRTKNGVQVDIKPKWYVVGYGRSTDDLTILADELVNRGFNTQPGTVNWFKVEFIDGVDVLTGFWNIVSVVEELDSIVSKSRPSLRYFAAHTVLADYCMMIANRYIFAIQNQDHDLLVISRDLLGADKADALIIRGRSVARTETDSWREHVVPCVMIHIRAIEMAKQGYAAIDIAIMIEENLIIVLISRAEQQKLDFELGLRTTMPEGWKFGDDPYARFVAADIVRK